jgi:hypothetical protein
MSWKSLAAAALVAGLCAGSSPRAGDLYRLTLPAEKATPAQTLALAGDADTVAVGWHGYRHAYYRPNYRGYGYYRYPGWYYPNVGFGIDFNYYAPADYYPPPECYTPPVSVYTTPPYYSPNGLSVETYSAPGGAATYSVTRPAAGPEPVQPPMPRANGLPGTFPYDGGPDSPVPMPKADPTSAPRDSDKAPRDGIRVSLPADSKEAKAKLAYPAYGDEARRKTAKK